MIWRPFLLGDWFASHVIKSVFVLNFNRFDYEIIDFRRNCFESIGVKTKILFWEMISF